MPKGLKNQSALIRCKPMKRPSEEEEESDADERPYKTTREEGPVRRPMTIGFKPMKPNNQTTEEEEEEPV